MLWVAFFCTRLWVPEKRARSLDKLDCGLAFPYFYAYHFRFTPGFQTAKYVTLVRLRYFEALSYGEVATQQQLPLGSVKAHLHRARALRAELLQGSAEGRWGRLLLRPCIPPSIFPLAPLPFARTCR
ncbi:sigma factor-like helix-turn-helix DNA-binding protein [Hymenobacter sp. B1770]|uniref:sigma factor-like helix-turn-helix DNA-binding protein n=1 Tax=Hymenobacter sp. B1770 TaxID=1718788 RepID=UPI003CEA35AA